MIGNTKLRNSDTALTDGVCSTFKFNCALTFPSRGTPSFYVSWGNCKNLMKLKLEKLLTG